MTMLAEVKARFDQALKEIEKGQSIANGMARQLWADTIYKTYVTLNAEDVNNDRVRAVLTPEGKGYLDAERELERVKAERQKTDFSFDWDAATATANASEAEKAEKAETWGSTTAGESLFDADADADAHKDSGSGEDEDADHDELEGKIINFIAESGGATANKVKRELGVLAAGMLNGMLNVGILSKTNKTYNVVEHSAEDAGAVDFGAAAEVAAIVNSAAEKADVAEQAAPAEIKEFKATTAPANAKIEKAGKLIAEALALLLSN